MKRAGKDGGPLPAGGCVGSGHLEQLANSEFGVESGAGLGYLVMLR
jgi:hypothetical protein